MTSKRKHRASSSSNVDSRQPFRKPKVRTTVDVIPKTEGQAEYIRLIEDMDIVLCNGPPGCGKSLLSIGMALKLLKTFPETYNRIIMVRPAIAIQGEDLGFLPGGIDDKMDPYMAPLMDSLRYYADEGTIQTLTYSSPKALEVIPLSFIRGRTFNGAIIILDEAQNSTPLQMKTFLTRIGFNSKAIVQGDITQSDLGIDDAMRNNGLYDAMRRLAGMEGIGVIELGRGDVVRSPIVARLMDRYK